MVEKSIFQLANIDSPFGDWKTPSSSTEDENFTLEQLYSEAGKYKTYQLLKKALPNNWTIRLRNDGNISSTAYRNYTVNNKKIVTTDILEIKINSKLPLLAAVGDLVFEITNALNSTLFEFLDIQAIKGYITKASYIKKIIRLEMESRYNLFRLYKEISEQDSDVDVLKELDIPNFVWLEFKQTLLPETNANHIPKNNWLDHLANIQYDDKEANDHALYGDQYDFLRDRGKRGGFKK